MDIERQSDQMDWLFIRSKHTKHLFQDNVKIASNNNSLQII